MYTWNKPCLYGIYSIAAVLYLQFELHVMLFRPLNMFRTFTLSIIIIIIIIITTFMMAKMDLTEKILYQPWRAELLSL